jgi:hypothetical protein
MADANEVFRAIIAATDDATATIEKIKAHLRELGAEAGHAAHEEGHLHKPHMWAAFGEHIDITREKFGGLHASIGEVAHSATELVPLLAGLGVAGSLVGIFETTEHVAESFALLAHAATEIGVPVDQLNRLRAVAKLTDTDVSLMERSVGRLSRVLAEAGAGKNKDAAALFAQLHLDPRSFKNGADALPALADAFEHTTSATMRARMAFALFGRAGMDMIPLLSKGGEKLRESMKEAGEYTINFGPYGENLERYNEDQKKLNLAVGGFTDLLGGKLAGVLAPVIEESTEFVLANREWITGDIAGGVGEFARWLEKLPFAEIGADLRTAGHYAGEFVDAIGGPKVAIEGLAAVMALKGVLFLAEPIKEAIGLGKAVGELTFKIGTELVAAWRGVGTAAAAAGKEEEAAAALSGVGGHGGEAGKAGSVAAHEAAQAGRVIRSVATVAKALPIIGTGVVVMSEVAPLLPVLVGMDVNAPDYQQKADEMYRRRHPASGGRHDYGTAPAGGGRTAGRHVEEGASWSGEAAHVIDRATDYLPRPIWSERPGYGPLSGTTNEARPAYASAVPPAETQNGKVDITLHLPNMPVGAMLETRHSGNVGDVRTNLGQAWMDGLF